MEQTKYKGKFIQVTEEKIRDSIYERAYLNECVIVIPIDDQNRIIFIKEIRPHENPNIRIKLVSGFVEKEYSLEENVNKELQEEIKLKAKKIIRFHTFNKTGSINEKKHYFIAKDLYSSPLENPDGEDVILDIIPKTLDEMRDDILNGNNSSGDTSFVLLKLYEDIKSGKIIL